MNQLNKSKLASFLLLGMVASHAFASAQSNATALLNTDEVRKDMQKDITSAECDKDEWTTIKSLKIVSEGRFIEDLKKGNFTERPKIKGAQYLEVFGNVKPTKYRITSQIYGPLQKDVKAENLKDMIGKKFCAVHVGD